MHKKLAVLIVCILFTTQAFPAGEEELGTRSFDVSALLDARADEPIGRIGLGDVFAYWGDEEEFPEEYGFLLPESLEDLVRSVVSPRKWSMDGMDISWVNETRLSVTATPEMLDAVGDLVGDLFLLAARRVEVRAELVTLDAEGAKRIAASGTLSALERGRLDAAARRAVLEEAGKPGSSVESGAIVVRPGACAALAQTSSVAYVSDMDVEIAQGSVVGDPIVRFATEGWLLNTRSFLLSDGDVWLEAIQQRASFPEPMRRVNPEAEPLGAIDFPIVAQERFFAAGRIAKGETLAVFRRSPGGARAVVALLLTPTVLGEAPGEGAVGYLPTSALTTSGLAAGSGWGGEDGGEWTTVPAPTRPAFLTAPSMVVLETAAPLTYLPGLHADLDAPIVEGTTGLFTPSPDAIATLGERIAERERVGLGSYGVRMVLHDEKGRFVTEVLLEAPMGRSTFFESGVTRAFLSDWDVEVAQEARVGDPIIGRAFGGILTNLRLAPSPGGDKVAGRVTLAVVELSPEMETRRTGNELTGIIEIPRARQTMLEHEIVAAPGEPVTVDGGRYRLTLTVTPR